MRAKLTVVAVLALAALGDAAPVEQASAEARSLFEALQARPRLERVRAEAVAGEEAEWKAFSVAQPELSPGKPGAPLGSFLLSERLDAQRDLLVRELGSRTFEIGIAGDPEFNTLYITARREGVLALQRVSRFVDLMGTGVDMVVEPGVVYNFRVKLDIFNFMRNSTLFINAVQGTQGPSHNLKTGELVDRLKARSFVFRLGRTEYALLYTTDVDVSADRLAGTRSFVFVSEAGASTKAWHVAESALVPGQPMKVSLGSNFVTILKTADGRLELYESAN